MAREKYILPEKEVYDRFSAIFDMDLAGFKDVVPMMATGKFSFDILGFEKRLQVVGYDPDSNQSMSQFVEKKYGQGAVDLIKSLLEF